MCNQNQCDAITVVGTPEELLNLLKALSEMLSVLSFFISGEPSQDVRAARALYHNLGDTNNVTNSSVPGFAHKSESIYESTLIKRGELL
jgi:hypothetical protein